MPRETRPLKGGVQGLRRSDVHSFVLWQATRFKMVIVRVKTQQRGPEPLRALPSSESAWCRWDWECGEHFIDEPWGTNGREQGKLAHCGLGRHAAASACVWGWARGVAV